MLRKITPPLEIDQKSMYTIFLRINRAGTDRHIRPGPFVEFFRGLYDQRLALIEQHQTQLKAVIDEKSESLEAMHDLRRAKLEGYDPASTETQNNPPLNGNEQISADIRQLNDTISEHVEQLTTLELELEKTVQGTGGTLRHKFVIASADVFLQNGLVAKTFLSGTTPVAPATQNANWIHNINKMLKSRILKRNRVLPLSQQKLGAAYQTKGDSMEGAGTQSRNCRASTCSLARTKLMSNGWW